MNFSASVSSSCATARAKIAGAASSACGWCASAQDGVLLIGRKIHIVRVQLNPHAGARRFAEHGGQVVRAQPAQDFEVCFAAWVDQAARQVRDADFAEREVHIQQRVQLIEPKLRFLLRRSAVRRDGEAGHVEMGGRDDDKVEIVEPAARNAQAHMPIHFRFAPEQKPHAVRLRERLRGRDVGKILPFVKIGRAGNVGVPKMVGQAEGVQVMILRVLQDARGRLRRVAGAKGNLAVNVQIAVVESRHGNPTPFRIRKN